MTPEPMPSLSTPIQRTEIRTERTRPRRHTILSRPDSAMALLSDIEDDNDDQEQQETFDRISGILSSLIQEANEAVNGIEQERVQLLSKKKFTSSTIITQQQQQQQQINSKIPRPRKLRVSNTPSLHHRNESSSSCTSTNSLFSPISTSTSATLLSRSPSPTNNSNNNNNNKKSLFIKHHTVLRPRSCPVPPHRRSMTPIKHKRNNSNLILISDPITESFKRLDTSMALVESLSRDLATQQQITTTKKNGFTFLLLVPLLHIPHSLVTMIFDFCFFKEPQQQNNSFSLSSMIFWACVFAVTNLMVDQVAVIPKKYINIVTRRMSLPGTFNNNHNKTRSTSKIMIKENVPIVKRTWIPATIQQQYQFRLGHDIPQPQKRRNSI